MSRVMRNIILRQKQFRNCFNHGSFFEPPEKRIKDGQPMPQNERLGIVALIFRQPGSNLPSYSSTPKPCGQFRSFRRGIGLGCFRWHRLAFELDCREQPGSRWPWKIGRVRMFAVLLCGRMRDGLRSDGVGRRDSRELLRMIVECDGRGGFCVCAPGTLTVRAAAGVMTDWRSGSATVTAGRNPILAR
jgi:hypothetical protein